MSVTQPLIIMKHDIFVFHAHLSIPIVPLVLMIAQIMKEIARHAHKGLFHLINETVLFRDVQQSIIVLLSTQEIAQSVINVLLDSDGMEQQRLANSVTPLIPHVLLVLITPNALPVQVARSHKQEEEGLV